MSKAATYLLWDLSTCSSNSVDCISKIAQILNCNFRNVFIYADKTTQIPPALGDLQIAMAISTRFGSYALYDVLTDVISAITEKRRKFNFVLISNKISLWLALFQQIQPSSLTVVSSVDPRENFDFSFLPDSIPTKILKWPSLAQVEGNDTRITIAQNQESSQDSYESAEDTANETQNQDETGATESVISELPEDKIEEEEDFEPAEQPSTPERQIEPEDGYYKSPKSSYRNYDESESSTLASPSVPESRNLLESNKRLDFRQTRGQPSPAPEIAARPSSKTMKAQASRPAAPVSNAVTIDAQYRPLIEAMKAVGKSMISLNDIESSLRSWCKREGVPPQDLMKLIDAATDSGLVIFDKSINYIRFRNRSLAAAAIEYE